MSLKQAIIDYPERHCMISKLQEPILRAECTDAEWLKAAEAAAQCAKGVIAVFNGTRVIVHPTRTNFPEAA